MKKIHSKCKRMRINQFISQFLLVLALLMLAGQRIFSAVTSASTDIALIGGSALCLLVAIGISKIFDENGSSSTVKKTSKTQRVPDTNHRPIKPDDQN